MLKVTKTAALFVVLSIVVATTITEAVREAKADPEHCDSENACPWLGYHQGYVDGQNTE